MSWTSTYLNAANIKKAGALAGKKIVQAVLPSQYFSHNGHRTDSTTLSQTVQIYDMCIAGIHRALNTFWRAMRNLASHNQSCAFDLRVLIVRRNLYSFAQNGIWRLGRLDTPTRAA